MPHTIGQLLKSCAVAIASAIVGVGAAAGLGAADVVTIDVTKPGTYRSGPWEYRLMITSPGSKSEGSVGILSFAGKRLEGAAPGDYYRTPWGVITWIGDSDRLWDAHGWMRLEAGAPPGVGRELSPPSSGEASTAGHSPQTTTREDVAHYSGTSDAFSPDGRIPYNNWNVLLKRAISDGGRVVVETWTRPAPSPSMAPEVRTLRLTRRAGSLVYDASDDESRCVGTATFTSAVLDAWTFDFDYGTDRRVTGTGRITAAGVSVVKAVQGPRSMRVVEELRPVSEGVYEYQKALMRPPKWAE